MSNEPIESTNTHEAIRGPEAPKEPGTTAVRLQRVADYQSDAAALPDPLRANLGLMNAGLMRIGQAIDEAVDQALRDGPTTIEQLDRLRPTIEMYLRITRQVDRFAQLELKTREVDSREAGLSPPIASESRSEEPAS